MGHAYSRFEPATPLRGIVTSAVDFRERAAPTRRLERPVVGAVVIVNLGPPIEVDDARVGSFAAGVWDRPTWTGHFGEQAGYQLFVDVLGVRRLLGVPAGALANRTVALDDLLGPFAGELVERLADAGNADERHQLAQRLLAARLTSASPASPPRSASAPQPEIAYVLGRLRESAGAARIGALAAEVGWSRRHLGARFAQEVGLAPKALARLIRVERATQRLLAGDPPAEVAFETGYADQPHFNRDFRELVGCTPTQFPFVQDIGPGT